MVVVFGGKRHRRVPADVPQIAGWWDSGWVPTVTRLGVPALKITDAGARRHQSRQWPPRRKQRPPSGSSRVGKDSATKGHAVPQYRATAGTKKALRKLGDAA